MQSPGRQSWRRLSCLALMGIAIVLAIQIAANGALRPERHDLFQDWASARNYFEGLPIYTWHVVTVPRYVGLTIDVSDRDLVEINAHPPTAVLLTLPFAWCDYALAFCLWNVLAIAAFLTTWWLVLRGVGMPERFWHPLPLVVIFVSEPLQAQLRQGALSIFVALLITATWFAARSGQHRWAGFWLALAIALKLFPAFLLVFFVVRRQWRTVGATLAWSLVLTLATLGLFGVDTYRAYVNDALPCIHEWRGSVANASLAAFWFMMLDPGTKGHILTMAPHYHALSLGGAMASCGVLSAVAAWSAARAAPDDADHAFGVAVSVMVLISPLSWNHYSLMLLLPFALVWARLPATWPWRGAFGVIVVVLACSAGSGWLAQGAEALWHGPARWAQPLYARLGVVGLGLATYRRTQSAAALVARSAPARRDAA